ncbi:MAG: tRNA (adenosine(37)-N6)-threonylcarbamoyltransferase complex dimerization subunit type 1 TsaB [Clostridiales bacterium]|jgi:tRNA threonylcarbamoyl adenosine modification protein YeaZ|nr:tRNA (adenosine(37)-N6)-threonylcarbamoyltransferase complex dimerization subunit type 1 TsaB [Clostridiales bacterium]
MNALIVDGTRDILLTILVKDDGIYSRKSLRAGGRHSALLFVHIDELFGEAELSVRDIDYFAGVVGPGSYTGIRIGACALTAMARALSKRLVSMDALEVLAYSKGLRGGGNYICLIDNGHDYYALQEQNGEKKYFVLPKELAANYENKFFRDENEYYIDGIVGLVRDKIARGEYGSEIRPFYMKKSQAEQKFSGG